MTNGEMLRREGRLQGRQQGRQEGRQEGRLEAIEGFLRAGAGWAMIESATGIDEQTYHGLKADLANVQKGAAQTPEGLNVKSRPTRGRAAGAWRIGYTVAIGYTPETGPADTHQAG